MNLRAQTNVNSIGQGRAILIDVQRVGSFDPIHRNVFRCFSDDRKSAFLGEKISTIHKMNEANRTMFDEGGRDVVEYLASRTIAANPTKMKSRGRSSGKSIIGEENLQMETDLSALLFTTGEKEKSEQKSPTRFLSDCCCKERRKSFFREENHIISDDTGDVTVFTVAFITDHIMMETTLDVHAIALPHVFLGIVQ